MHIGCSIDDPGQGNINYRNVHEGQYIVMASHEMAGLAELKSGVLARQHDHCKHNQNLFSANQNCLFTTSRKLVVIQGESK